MLSRRQGVCLSPSQVILVRRRLGDCGMFRIADWGSRIADLGGDLARRGRDAGGKRQSPLSEHCGPRCWWRRSDRPSSARPCRGAHRMRSHQSDLLYPSVRHTFERICTVLGSCAERLIFSRLVRPVRSCGVFRQARSDDRAAAPLTGFRTCPSTLLKACLAPGSDGLDSRPGGASGGRVS
jgi:hypothetical protein